MRADLARRHTAGTGDIADIAQVAGDARPRTQHDEDRLCATPDLPVWQRIARLAGDTLDQRRQAMKDLVAGIVAFERQANAGEPRALDCDQPFRSRVERGLDLPDGDPVRAVMHGVLLASRRRYWPCR